MLCFCIRTLPYDTTVVWVTDRMNDKEDELADLQDQLERYESLVKTLKPDKPVDKGAQLKRTIEEVFTSICGEGWLVVTNVERLM